MNNPPPLRDPIPSGAWDNWFNQIFEALKGINRSTALLAERDFGSIVGQSQASLTVAVKGARLGDSVLIAPASDVAGVISSGAVTGADVVTIYAKNFTAGTIDPPSMNFRVTVIQN